jgi:hypothetical protein
MHGRKAAARDRREIIELIEQRTRPPLLDDRDLSQTAQHTMREGGGTLAAAGKRHDEHDLALRVLQHRQQCIAGPEYRHSLCGLRQWLIGRHHRRLAAAQQQWQRRGNPQDPSETVF